MPLTSPSAPRGAHLDDFQLRCLVLDPRFKSLKLFKLEQPTIKNRAKELLREDLKTVSDAEVKAIEGCSSTSISLSECPSRCSSAAPTRQKVNEKLKQFADPADQDAEQDEGSILSLGFTFIEIIPI